MISRGDALRKSSLSFCCHFFSTQIRNLPFTCTIPDVVTSLTEQLNADGDEVKDPVTFVKFVGGGEHPSSGKAFVKMRKGPRLIIIEASVYAQARVR